MDFRRYTTKEISNIANRYLNENHPHFIKPPIDIEHFAQVHPDVEHLYPVPGLQENYDVAAVTTKNSNQMLEIVVDKYTYDIYPFRANFSIAHELGHIILHKVLFDEISTIEEAVTLQQNIRSAYRYIENQANRFAGEILMPRARLIRDAHDIYNRLANELKIYNDSLAKKFFSELSRLYHVTIQPMQIRMNELNLAKSLLESIRDRSPHLTI